MRAKLIGRNVTGRLPEDRPKGADVDLAVYRDGQCLASAIIEHPAELRMASTLRGDGETKALKNRHELRTGIAPSPEPSPWTDPGQGEGLKEVNVC